MMRTKLILSAAVIATLLVAPAVVRAQDEKQKEKADKEKTEKKESEQIVITRKTDNKQKVVVEINGDKVTVNGKPVEDLKDNELDGVTINRHKLKGAGSMRAFASPNGAWSYNWNEDNGMFFDGGENTAMLGGVTDKVDQGVKITDITDESGAAKAGLKENDIITKVDDKKIEDPDDLTKVIRSHKPGDKVSITYLRDKKEQKASAELGKWKGGGFNALAKIPDMDWNAMGPKGKMGAPYSFTYNDSRPKLGLSVQDTEDGKGVKVIDVDDEGNAKKAGVKEDDVITSINDKEVNSADEVARIVRESREKPSLMLKIKRAGKIQNIEVRMPRKLKTADL